jgi:hypothetical protein
MRDGVVAFSDWAVEKNSPTAVTLREFRAGSAPDSVFPLGLVGIGLGGLAVWIALSYRNTGYYHF